MVAAAFFLASTAAAVAGPAGAQAVNSIVVLPAAADPGGVVTVSNNGVVSACPPPDGTSNPSASVDVFATGSATPANRAPFQGVVTAAGTWSVEVRLAPDWPPGIYRVQAGCYSDSGLNSGYKLDYAPGRLDLRLQEPGPPTASPGRGVSGDSIQVSSGEARCTPPAGSASPRVRVSLNDAGGATRAEAEAPVDARTGRWSVGLRVPDLAAQTAAITAVCLSRVGAPAPYARYRPARFPIDADSRPSAPGTTPPTTSPAPTAGPGAPPPTPPAPTPGTTPAAALPPTPLAAAIVAEPTYTG